MNVYCLESTRTAKPIHKGHYTIQRYPERTNYRHPTWKLYDDTTGELVVTCSYLKGAIATAERLLSLENAIKVPLNVPSYASNVINAFYDALVGRAEYSPSLDKWYAFYEGLDVEDDKLVLCAKGDKTDGCYKNPYLQEATHIRTWLALQLKATARLEVSRSEWRAGNQYQLDTFGGKITVAEVFDTCNSLLEA